MKTFRILVLEDDLGALSVIMNRLFRIEQELNDAGDIAVTVLSEYTQVEEYANNTEQEFDLVLLDRDCRACGSFHVLDFKKFNPDKIIAISTYPEYNKSAKEFGVEVALRKDYEKIEEWGDELQVLIKNKLQIK
jgi:hypothetical protein